MKLFIKKRLNELLIQFRKEKHNLKGEFVIIIEGENQEGKKLKQRLT